MRDLLRVRYLVGSLPPDRIDETLRKSYLLRKSEAMEFLRNCPHTLDVSAQ